MIIIFFWLEKSFLVTKFNLNAFIHTQKLDKLINDFSTEPKQKKLESLIDENYNNAMEKVKAPEIGLSEEELQLFRYKVAGFPI